MSTLPMIPAPLFLLLKDGLSCLSRSMQERFVGPGDRAVLVGGQGAVPRDGVAGGAASAAASVLREVGPAPPCV